jgi:single-strand DNA-binding protein
MKNCSHEQFFILALLSNSLHLPLAMANLNKVMLIGNLTRDPELRYTPSGKAVADIALAINRVWVNDQGQKQEDTTFVDVTLWGRQAELAQQYLTKGRGAYIEGRLQMDTWDDKETGKKRSRLKVVGDNLQFLPDGRGAAGGGAPPQGGAPQRSSAPGQRNGPPQGASAAPQGDFQEEDDIPF